MDRHQLLGLIQEKKAKVGGGYLTDQGALFLVASDLGVSVDYDHERPASISKLVSDQKTVTVVARLISIGVPRASRGSQTRARACSQSSRFTITLLMLWSASGSPPFSKSLILH